MSRPKKSRGRPARPLPTLQGADPEDVARALLTTPPKYPDEWDYTKEQKAGQKPRKAAKDGGDSPA